MGFLLSVGKQRISNKMTSSKTSVKMENIPDTAPRMDCMVENSYQGEGVQVAFYNHDTKKHTTRVYPDMDAARKMAAFIAMTLGKEGFVPLNNWLSERGFGTFSEEHMDNANSVLQEAKESESDSKPKIEAVQDDDDEEEDGEEKNERVEASDSHDGSHE